MELRQWCWSKLRAHIPFLEILGNLEVGGLAEKRAEKSGSVGLIEDWGYRRLSVECRF